MSERIIDRATVFLLVVGCASSVFASPKEAGTPGGDSDRKVEYVSAVVRGEGFLPWQEKGVSDEERAFRAEMERRKDEMLAKRVPVKHLLFKGKLRPGMVVQLNTSDGRIPVTVVKVGRHSADIDTNHPLAGQALSFDIEVVDVRAATEEEVAHGHAHGPGGHQH